MNKEKWIKQLDLEPHPEGGFYKELEPSAELTENSESKKNAHYILIFTFY